MEARKEPQVESETLEAATASREASVEEPREEGEEGGDEAKPSAADPTTAAAVGPVTDFEKKLLRAERFGMPVQPSEEAKRRSRAKRFATGSTSPIKDDGEKLEEQKRKARAERFGLVGDSAAEEAAKKKSRSARFALDPKPDALEEEKRKARAIRFSGTSNAPSDNNGNANVEL